MAAAGDHNLARLLFCTTEFNSELVQNYARTPELVNE
jgi:hypothetical protein